MGCDGSSDVRVECLAEGGEVHEAVDSAELFGRFEHPGGAPAQDHLAVAPALHVRAVVAADFDHRLDRVGGPQRSRQGRGHAEAADGQRRGEAFAQGGRGAGVRLGELAGEGFEFGLGPRFV
jgi:hypothetical protein